MADISLSPSRLLCWQGRFGTRGRDRTWRVVGEAHICVAETTQWLHPDSALSGERPGQELGVRRPTSLSQTFCPRQALVVCWATKG